MTIVLLVFLVNICTYFWKVPITESQSFPATVCEESYWHGVLAEDTPVCDPGDPEKVLYSTLAFSQIQSANRLPGTQWKTLPSITQEILKGSYIQFQPPHNHSLIAVLRIQSPSGGNPICTNVDPERVLYSSPSQLQSLTILLAKGPTRRYSQLCSNRDPEETYTGFQLHHSHSPKAVLLTQGPVRRHSWLCPRALIFSHSLSLWEVL